VELKKRVDKCEIVGKGLPQRKMMVVERKKCFVIEEGIAKKVRAFIENELRNGVGLDFEEGWRRERATGRATEDGKKGV
jgi:hypothetical protein